MRSERDRYNDHVEALLRDLGLELEDFDGREQSRLLQDARQRRLNEHEAALAVAYGHAPVLLDDDLERARVLMDRLALTAEQWQHQGLVNRHRLAPLEREARAALKRAGT